MGCIVVAAGWQACGTTLVSLRSIIHSLRGWPTPFGAALNTATIFLTNPGRVSKSAAAQLGILGRQVVEFASRYNR